MTLLARVFYDEMEAARTRSLAAAFSGAVVSTSGSPRRQPCWHRITCPGSVRPAYRDKSRPGRCGGRDYEAVGSEHDRPAGFSEPWNSTSRVDALAWGAPRTNCEGRGRAGEPSRKTRVNDRRSSGSRKGGVGKTSHAAGVAIVAGAALDAVGRCTAIVDANIANPDAWGQLNLPPWGGDGARHDRCPGHRRGATKAGARVDTRALLACFPEARETSEYSRTEIGLFVAWLRLRYPLVVVDMSNRLPDPTAGPEASAAAYWLEHADVLVLPTAASKQDFNGVLDYLDVRDLPPTIVASLVPRTRRNREHPLAKRYMTAIAQRVYRVVDMPDDAERVAMRAWKESRSRRCPGRCGVRIESLPRR